MQAKLYTATLIGLDCKIVEVEVDYRKGQTHFSVVGLADKSIQEAKDRIPPAIRNSGAEFIPVKIIINLAPAELHKSGPSYDLPLAIGYLIASDQLEFDPEGKIFVGELALDGRLRPVSGILPLTDAIQKLGFKEIYLPKENAAEASLVKNIKIFPVETLKQLMDHLGDVTEITEYISKNEDIFSKLNDNEYKFDISQIKGQDHAKRALEIAAAGGHNILLSGVPGSGKTLLSRCFPSILPKLTLDESLEVTRIYSISGALSEKQPLIVERPFRSPHHTSSQVALVGGGGQIKPGEISLAHRGVLFLDEFPEFSTQAIEALRQPLEDRIVNISRASGTLTFPANFILIAAMNPCKCGYRGDEVKQCTCSNSDIIRYQKKLSGPILDRFDLLINVHKVENEKLFGEDKGQTSKEVRERVQNCRNIQIGRLRSLKLFSNSEMSHEHIKLHVKLDQSSKQILELAVKKMNLSARSYFRILKVARTISDLEGLNDVKQEHIIEALSYRVEIGN